MIDHTLIALFPAAEHLRPAGQCPICRRDALISFTLPDFERRHLDNRGVLMESCGCFCSSCHWSAPTSRPVTEDQP